MLPDHKSILTVMTIVGKAKGSIIHEQLQDFTAPNLLPTSVNGSSSVAPASKLDLCEHYTSQTAEEVILQCSAGLPLNS